MPLPARRWFSALAYRDAVLATNPVAYWRLGERSGTVARDEMGANNGAYVNAPTLGVAGLLAGDADRGVTLNGTSQYVYLPNTTSDTSGVKSCSLSVWVNAAPPAVTRYLLGNFYSSVSAGLWLAVDPAGSYIVRRDASAAQDYVAGPILNGTHHLVGTYDGATMRLYVDGASVGTPAASSRVLPAVVVTRAGLNEGATGSLSGTIDELAIWNRALTAAEVAALYRVGMGR